jgi:trk system potassium uptake protein TrkA
VSRYVVIGLGKFGSFVSRRLYELGHEVVAIDSDVALVDAHGPYVTRAIAGDATNRHVLDEAGAEGADSAIVAIGENLGTSVLALLALRDLGVKSIFVKVLSDEHARIADALGATDTVFPEREAAQNLASRVTSGKLLQYTTYGEQFGIQEMSVPDTWAGKTLAELDLLVKHKIQCVAVHDNLRDTIEIPKPDQKLVPSDTLLIAGKPAQLVALTKVR